MPSLRTVGDLKNFIAELPDDMSIRSRPDTTYDLIWPPFEIRVANAYFSSLVRDGEDGVLELNFGHSKDNPKKVLLITPSCGSVDDEVDDEEEDENA